ncbi:hypothetical protein HOY82DRAFT_579810 [Tuber indicum]|nr:hypothetical protein HOY82DRAFT_579810 [Tuber indicum]
MFDRGRLNPSWGVILQLYCYITDRELNLLDEEGHKTVVHYEKEVLDNMGDWCIIPRVLESTVTIAQATEGILTCIKKLVPGKGYSLPCLESEVVYREVRWKTFSHDAGMDTLGSIGELRYYGSVIFDGKNREVG